MKKPLSPARMFTLLFLTTTTPACKLLDQYCVGDCPEGMSGSGDQETLDPTDVTVTSDSETILGRRFDHQHTGMGGSLEIRDDRIFGSRTVRVPIPENAARASVRIRYERVAVDTPQMTSVFDSTPLFERDLIPQPQL